MKPRSTLTVGLLTVFWLAACAPAASPEPAQPQAPLQPLAQATETPAQSQPLPAQTQPPAIQNEVPLTEPPQAIATSRGPNLEASDPGAFNLASGELQLVEFFRFT